jgi:hypothetical protein
MKFVLCLVAGMLTARPAFADPGQTDVSLWERVEKAMTSIQQLRYVLVKRERPLPDKELTPDETFAVKFRKPYDIYMDVLEGPNAGRHYLYRDGWPYLKVHVFGRLLQWMVPNIPPISRLALSGTHHPISDASYAATCDFVRSGLLRNKTMREQDPTHPAIHIDPVQEVIDDGVPSYYYRSLNPDLFRTYTATPEDKTTFDLSRKLETAPHLFVYYNPDKLKNFDDVRPGMTLRYPLYYARVTEFWIDKKTLLLHHIRVTDFNGKLYEEYLYRDLVTDSAAGLTDHDFDPKNPDYGGF